jgi:mono/diheme cytochrome c family protein
VNEQAQLMFNSVCATCHGADGTGNGPVAETLQPKPRNYTDAAWQASVTDDELRMTILKGGQAVGKSPMMPGNPQLADKPEVLDGLVQIIRNFKK